MDIRAKTFLSEPSYKDISPPTSDAESGADSEEQLARISTARYQVERDESLDCTLTQRDLSPTQCKPELSLRSHLLELIAKYPDSDGDVVLHMAAVHEELPVAQLWKNALPHHFKSDLNKQNHLGQTPLHVAICNNDLPMIDFFLKNGASVLIHEGKGRTPVHFACQYGTIETLNLILQHIKHRRQSLPAALNAEACNGGLNSLLFFVSQHNPVREDQFPVVDLLINCGADPNHQDKCSGKTLIHYLADQNNVALYKYLQTNYCSKIDWNAARYDGGRVFLQDDIFVFEKEEL
ncbi:ankyrin repeat domain-containing protein [Endozoicomonas sp. YOMI1]|uniref:ankyrin repeat domain-containing protein n=1 Tax=Endozoicomonas sp. YOMI1 TaxID=2828739 RepID=UPI002147E852|nr:ankyrin repeat domain-containing protein [Endozoicomonas sp. YOMI1]